MVKSGKMMGRSWMRDEGNRGIEGKRIVCSAGGYPQAHWVAVVLCWSPVRLVCLAAVRTLRTPQPSQPYAGRSKASRRPKLQELGLAWIGLDCNCSMHNRFPESPTQTAPIRSFSNPANSYILHRSDALSNLQNHAPNRKPIPPYQPTTHPRSLQRT
jgi:hypothetical protein